MKNLSVKFGLRTIYDHRDLLRSLVRREIEVKYRGSFLGKLWILFLPLLMLGVYTFVFGTIYGSRWGGSSDVSDFVPMLYCGLIVHAIFAETVGKSSSLIVNNPNYVKKVIFPLELLPLGTLSAALFNAGFSFLLLLVLNLILKGELNWTLIATPLVILPLVLYAIGIAWLISALGVFFRDIEQIIGVLMSMLLFLSPVFYSVHSAPQLAQAFLKFNPLTYPIEEVRNVVLLGQLPHWQPWLLQMLIGFLVAWFGLWVFERVRPAFADVV
jgi:lipopolysaccharide transport system permease protein